MSHFGHQSEQNVFDARQARAHMRASADGRVIYGMGAPADQQAGFQGANQGAVPGAGIPQQPLGATPAYPAQQMYVQQGYGNIPPGYIGAMPYPLQMQTQGNPPKKKRKTGLVIVLVIAIILIAAAVMFALFTCNGENEGSRRAGTLGQLEGKTREEIQAELDRVVEEGMFNISIASVAQFADGASEGELRIENVPGNRYLMQVDIVLEDTGETVYESGIIEPDHHIQKDRLLVNLPKGSYDAIATFRALDPSTEEEVGTAAAKMVIQVMA